MVRLFCIVMASLMVSSCEAEYIPPYLLYKAQSDVSKVDEADHVIKQIAEQWNLRVYEKDREQMEFHTQGKAAFFIALYFEDDPIVVLTNSGFGELLVLSITDHKKMPINDLQRLAAEVVSAFESRLNIEFERSEESTAPVHVG